MLPYPATSHMNELRPREERGTAIAARARDSQPRALSRCLGLSTVSKSIFPVVEDEDVSASAFKACFWL